MVQELQLRLWRDWRPLASCTVNFFTVSLFSLSSTFLAIMTTTEIIIAIPVLTATLALAVAKVVASSSRLVRFLDWSQDECTIPAWVLPIATSNVGGANVAFGRLDDLGRGLEALDDRVGGGLGTGAGDALLAKAPVRKCTSGDGHKDRDDSEEKERARFHLCLMNENF